MDEKQFVVIVDKLDKILKLMARREVGGMPKEQDKIEALDSLDFKPGEIAKMLGKSPENVSVVLGNIRKKKASPPAKIADQSGTTGTSQEVVT